MCYDFTTGLVMIFTSSIMAGRPGTGEVKESRKEEGERSSRKERKRTPGWIEHFASSLNVNVIFVETVPS